MVSEDIQKLVARREESERRLKVLELIKLIQDGQINSARAPFSDSKGGPRQEYISPKDRDTYNYGYMEVSEMESP